VNLLSFTQQSPKMSEKIMRYGETLEEERKKEKRREMREKKWDFSRQNKKSDPKMILKSLPEIFLLYSDIIKVLQE
jgi:hypothetical protein